MNKARLANQFNTAQAAHDNVMLGAYEFRGGERQFKHWWKECNRCFFEEDTAGLALLLDKADREVQKPLSGEKKKKGLFNR